MRLRESVCSNICNILRRTRWCQTSANTDFFFFLQTTKESKKIKIYNNVVTKSIKCIRVAVYLILIIILLGCHQKQSHITVSQKKKNSQRTKYFKFDIIMLKRYYVIVRHDKLFKIYSKIKQFPWSIPILQIVSISTSQFLICNDNTLLYNPITT